MGRKGLLTRIVKFIFLTTLFVLTAEIAYTFSIKKVEIIDIGNGRCAINVSFSSFPTQDILLTLKRQRRDVLILYDFELRTRDNPDEEPFHKEIYFQRAGYNSETNTYYLEDNFGIIHFQKPEELLPHVVYLNSYPLLIDFFKLRVSNAQLYIKVSINFTTNFDKNLRFAKVEKRRLYQASTKYVMY